MLHAKRGWKPRLHFARSRHSGRSYIFSGLALSRFPRREKKTDSANYNEANCRWFGNRHEKAANLAAGKCRRVNVQISVPVGQSQGQRCFGEGSCVSSNAHARMSAIGKPTTIIKTMSRTPQFGISKKGKTCVATWINNQPTTA